MEHEHVRLITGLCKVIMLVFSFTHYKYHERAHVFPSLGRKVSGFAVKAEKNKNVVFSL